MNRDWTTKSQDLATAMEMMEAYAERHNLTSIGLFELSIHPNEKSMQIRIADWVLLLAQHYRATYGVLQGEYVTRKVVSSCIVNGETIH